MKTPKPRS